MNVYDYTPSYGGALEIIPEKPMVLADWVTFLEVYMGEKLLAVEDLPPTKTNQAERTPGFYFYHPDENELHVYASDYTDNKAVLMAAAAHFQTRLASNCEAPHAKYNFPYDPFALIINPDGTFMEATERYRPEDYQTHDDGPPPASWFESFAEIEPLGTAGARLNHFELQDRYGEETDPQANLDYLSRTWLRLEKWSDAYELYVLTLNTQSFPNPVVRWLWLKNFPPETPEEVLLQAKADWLASDYFMHCPHCEQPYPRSYWNTFGCATAACPGFITPIEETP
ncbi:MAG: hypothetical protein ACO1RX_12500 [Candidatus Sericytochromatia bacterium]